MNEEHSSQAVAVIEDEKARNRKRIRKLIILVVLVSIGVHLVAGIGAGIWVIARYFTKPEAIFTVQKTVDMKPEEREHQLAMEEVASLRPKPVYNNRIQSLRPSKLALPELPSVPLENIVTLDTEALVTDAVDGVGQSQGTGGGGSGFFGDGVQAAGLLEGTFYDLKQTADGKSTNIVTGGDKGRANHDRWVSGFVSAGLRPTSMRKYFQAPKKLYMSQMIIPNIRAEDAPKAFEVNVEPGNWVIVYRGRISPPQDGVYRFAGSADDTLIVRFNNRVVLEGSLQQVTRWKSRDDQSHIGAKPIGGLWQIEPGSIIYGDWLTMKAGQSYPIEIMIGEQPGESFSASLFVQEQGVDYAKDNDGGPILPRFRVSPKAPEVPNPTRLYAPDGPIFNAAPASASGL